MQGERPEEHSNRFRAADAGAPSDAPSAAGVGRPPVTAYAAGWAATKFTGLYRNRLTRRRASGKVNTRCSALQRDTSVIPARPARRAGEAREPVMTRPVPFAPLRRRLFALAIPAAFGGLVRPAAANERPLELGVLPNISARVLLEQYRPMREWLGRRRAQPVEVSTAPGWPAFQQRTLALDYDVIVTAANLARVAQLDRGWRPILVYAPEIPALLVTQTGRPLKDVRELRGGTLVLSNPQSLVALRGMQWLAEQGLRAGDFTATSVRADDSVGAVVMRGDARAAILSGGEFRAIPEGVRAGLEVSTTFARVPGFVVMTNPRMSRTDSDGFARQLLDFGADANEGKAFFQASGFQAIRELPAGLMESLDAFAEPTRRALAG
jgi:phosphonate transport system substrate-binding protein